MKLTVFRSNQADPHDVELTREVIPPVDVTGRMAGAGVGYVRVPSIGSRTVDQLKTQIADVTKSGAAKLIVDVRRTSTGTYEQGIALARLFVAKGTLAMRDSKGAPAREMIVSNTGDGAITAPVILLIHAGRRAPPSLCLGSGGNQRADLIGEHTHRTRRHSKAG